MWHFEERTLRILVVNSKRACTRKGRGPERMSKRRETRGGEWFGKQK